MRTGVADLPLHNGRAPRWLFARMAKLAGEMVELQALQRLDRFFLPAQAGTQASEWRHSGHRTALWAPARPAETIRHFTAMWERAGARLPTTREIRF